MKVVVTGASGYIGLRVVEALRREGHTVLAATRRPLAGLAHIPFDLARPDGVRLPADTECVIHLAAETRGQGVRPGDEIAAARTLLAQASPLGARMVFVSSQAAAADAPNAYGRTKWAIEQGVLQAGGAVLRPGQVYGGRAGGLYATLLRLVRRMPVLPALRPAPRVQPVHVDDLAQAIVRVGTGAAFNSRVWCIADPRPIDFAAFLAAIARHRLRRARAFVPVPALLVHAARRLASGRATALDRLASLLALRPMDTAADLAALQLQLRPLEQGLRDARGNRRALVQEARAFLRYVLGERPDAGVWRRHVRATERVRGGTALELPLSVLRWPALLALYEAPAGGAGRADADAQEFAWRLDCACALAEASPQGARVFLGTDAPASAWRAWAGLLRAAAGEVLARVTRALLGPVVTRRGAAR